MTHPFRFQARLVAVALALAGLLGGIAPAFATFTDPVLALSTARTAVGDTRVLVQLTGVFPQGDLVQIPYPLQLLVRDGAGGTQYVRFDLSAGAFAGSFAGLSDGLDSAEAIQLLAEGTPTSAARTTLLVPGRIEVSLPTTFPRTDLRAQLFILDEGMAILSNELPAVLAVGGP